MQEKRNSGHIEMFRGVTTELKQLLERFSLVKATVSTVVYDCNRYCTASITAVRQNSMKQSIY